jgi:hypothetical protein
MDQLDLVLANNIKKDLDLLSYAGGSTQAIQDNEEKTPEDMLKHLSETYSLLRNGITDVETINAINVAIADFRDAFKASIEDSSDSLNTALSAI